MMPTIFPDAVAATSLPAGPPALGSDLSAPPRRQPGFSLLELLIAMAIFALLGILGYSGLNQLLAGERAVAAQSRDLAELQFAMRLLERDLAEVLPRSARDDLGDPRPALETGPYPQLLSFTHWSAGLAALGQPARLERVSYGLEGRSLVRLLWPRADRAPTTPVQRAVLLQSVDAVGIRLLDDADWRNSWPPGPEQMESLPRGLEFSLEHPRWGRITRLFGPLP